MQTGSTLMPSATHPRSGSAIFYGGSHYSQTEIPEGFETSFLDYSRAFQNIPRDCGFPLTYLHSKDDGEVEPQENFVDWRIEAMKMAGWTLNKKFDVERSYKETHGQIDRLHDIVGKMFWAIYRTEWKPDTPKDGSKPWYDSFRDSDTIKGRYKGDKARTASRKAVEERRMQIEAQRKRDAREQDQYISLAVKKLQGEGKSQWYIDDMSEQDLRAIGIPLFNQRMNRQKEQKREKDPERESLATQAEFMTFRGSPEFKAGWETKQNEWCGVVKVPERLRKYSYSNAPRAFGHIPHVTNRVTTSTMSHVLSKIADQFQVSVSFTPGRKPGDARVIFVQNRFNQFGALPIDGNERADRKEGILHCFTPFNDKHGFSVGLTPSQMWRKVLPERFAGYTKHPTLGLPRALNDGHLEYGNNTDLVFYITAMDGRTIKYEVITNNYSLSGCSAEGLVLELRAPKLVQPKYSIPQPLPKPSVQSALEQEKQKIKNKKEQKVAEAKVASLNKEAEKIKAGLVKKKPSEAAPVSTGDMVSQLKDLKELLDVGALSQEEFDAAKKKILG